MSSPPSDFPVAPPPPSPDLSVDPPPFIMCGVCLETAIPPVVFAPCGHLFCGECTLRIHEAKPTMNGYVQVAGLVNVPKPKCPICQQKIVAFAVSIDLRDQVVLATKEDEKKDAQFMTANRNRMAPPPAGYQRAPDGSQPLRTGVAMSILDQSNADDAVAVITPAGLVPLHSGVELPSERWPIEQLMEDTGRARVLAEANRTVDRIMANVTTRDAIQRAMAQEDEIAVRQLGDREDRFRNHFAAQIEQDRMILTGVGAPLAFDGDAEDLSQMVRRHPSINFLIDSAPTEAPSRSPETISLAASELWNDDGREMHLNIQPLLIANRQGLLTNAEMEAQIRRLADHPLEPPPIAPTEPALTRFQQRLAQNEPTSITMEMFDDLTRVRFVGAGLPNLPEPRRGEGDATEIREAVRQQIQAVGISGLRRIAEEVVRIRDNPNFIIRDE